MEINGGGTGTGVQLQEMTVKAVDENHNGLSLFLTEKYPGNTFPWVFTIDATSKRGRMRLGIVRTVPSGSSGSPPTRVIAMANVPGAHEWTITCQAPAGALADLDAVTQRAYGPCGLTVLSENGVSLPPIPGRAVNSSVNAAGTGSLGLLAGAVVAAFKTRLWEFKGMRVGGGPIVYFQSFDSATLPVLGAIPLDSSMIAPNQNFAIMAGNGLPIEMANGITWAISSTPDTYTPAPALEFWVRTYHD